jgi:hypothetical protein
MDHQRRVNEDFNTEDIAGVVGEWVDRVSNGA